MELRARIRPTLRRTGLMVAAAALLVPAAPASAKKPKAPVVKRVTPKNAFVGETMTIRGRHFRAGVGKNTVAFKRRGAKVVLVRADKSTKKMMRVELPKRLEKVLPVRNGTPVATKLQIRVFTSRFGKRYTSRAKSPLVGPQKPPAPPKPKAADPDGDCDLDGQVNRIDADDDNDLLSDVDEANISKLLDRCNADTDGDGVEDGYEHRSARDLNDDEYGSDSVPYPAKRPYPNPLDKTDVNTDHDGDTLSLLDEYKLWVYTADRTLTPLTYSAGEQYSKGKLPSKGFDGLGYDKQLDFLKSVDDSGRRYVSLVNLDNGGGPRVLPVLFGDWSVGMPDRFGARTAYEIRDIDRSGDPDPADPLVNVDPDEEVYYDYYENGFLDDAERDEDADGLANQWEASGCMKQGYWTGLYDKESPYYLTYDDSDIRLDDPDSDGDGIRDGADDADHDDVPNLMECSRDMADHQMVNRTWQGFVNPFNPCLPHPRSRSCKTYVEVGPGGKKWAPFNDSEWALYYSIKN
jgi:hypothetical protein